MHLFIYFRKRSCYSSPHNKVGWKVTKKVDIWENHLLARQLRAQKAVLTPSEPLTCLIYYINDFYFTEMDVVMLMKFTVISHK